jgi:hypothetical protein
VSDNEQAVALALFAAAERYGCYRWLEHRLFEVTGAFAPLAAAPGASVHLAAASILHATCADLWRDRLPVLAEVDPEALTEPAGDAAALVASLAREATRDDRPAATLGVLHSLYDVIGPRLLATYREHLERAAPVADAPGMRALRFALREHELMADQGRSLLDRLTRELGVTESVTGPDLALRSAEVIVPWPTTAHG